MSRHNIPAKPHRFVCNALEHRYIRNRTSGRGPCFVSIFVYFCLLPRPCTVQMSLVTETPDFAPKVSSFVHFRPVDVPA